MSGARRPAFPWDESHIARVAQMMQEGLSARQIGDQIGVSKSAIIGKARKVPSLKAIGFKTPNGWPKGSSIKGHKAKQDKKAAAPKIKMSVRTGMYAAPKPTRKVASPFGATNIFRKAERRREAPGLSALPAPTRMSVAPRLVKLVDLKPNECRWPVGDPKAAGFGFCGHDRLLPHVYCPAHCRIAYSEFACAVAA